MPYEPFLLGVGVVYNLLMCILFFARVVGELGAQFQEFARRGHEANASATPRSEASARSSELGHVPHLGDQKNQDSQHKLIRSTQRAPVEK